MPAGYLFVNGAFWDNDKRDRYSKALPPIYKQFGGHYIAYGGPIEVIEGVWAPRGSLIAQFDSPELVERFWWCPEYRAAATIRQGGGAFTVLKLDGRLPAMRPPQGSAFLIMFAKVRDESALNLIQGTIEAIAGRVGGETLAVAPANSLRPLEGAFYDTAIHLSRWPSMAALKGFLADPHYAALAAERRALGDIVVLARPALDNPPF
ncbi:MAG: DUF1330 domain-containing protein [Alphaproteobacteria bacterium]|nr:DUF1330 domain-containing protein [Alphaproteobacteria bacterium]